MDGLQEVFRIVATATPYDLLFPLD